MKQKKSVHLRNLLLGSAAVLAVGALTANNANATNGYFAHGYGTHYKAMAGAGAPCP